MTIHLKPAKDAFSIETDQFRNFNQLTMNPNLSQSETSFEEIKTEPFYWEKILPPVKKETEKKTENIPCPICGKVFRKEFDIKRHLYTHTGEKPFKVKINCYF